MKKAVKAAIIVVVIIALIGAAGIIKELNRKTKPNAQTVSVSIPVGCAETKIADILKEKSIIESTLAFKIKLRFSQYRGKLNYGKFNLSSDMSIEDIIRTLATAGAGDESVKLTIPEGYSAQMIAQKCRDLGICSESEFLSELKNGTFDVEFIKDIPQKDGVEYSLQGYLFPNTYQIRKGTGAHDVIEKLLKEFEKHYTRLASKNTTGLSMNDIVIISSLIEREAKVPSEREIISGVIQNRIKANMPLQIDASVIYAVSGGIYDMDRVMYKDLKIQSPYNTYAVAGIPAGAICSPGEASILAAMKPQKHKYLYYHTDTEKNDGTHIFTETFSQHRTGVN